MDAKQKNSDKKKEEAAEPVEVYTNPELGIKKVRTFEEDLREARRKAGAPEELPVEDKGGFFGRRKKKKMDDGVKKLSETSQPSTTPEPNKNVPKKSKQPSKAYIEKELAKSGIISKDSAEDLETKKEVASEENESSVPVIRTLKYDAAESIDDKKLSRVSIAAAEQNRRAKNKDFSYQLPNEKTPIGKNIVYLLLSLVLVVVGSWGGYYFFNQSKIENEAVQVVNEGIILFTNSEKDLSVGKASGAEMISILENERVNNNTDSSSIRKIEISESSLLGEKDMSARSFLEKIGNVPGPLSRSMRDKFLFGVHGGAKASPLFIFKTEDFDTAFAGMLNWENAMSADMSPLFGESINGEFEDVILRNKDTRLLRNKLGETVIIYAFPNSETVLLTTNENTFFEVFERLTVSNAKRN